MSVTDKANWEHRSVLFCLYSITYMPHWKIFQTKAADLIEICIICHATFFFFVHWAVFEKCKVQFELHVTQTISYQYELKTTGKLKRSKSLGTDHIPAELIKAGGETLCYEIHISAIRRTATAVEGIYYCTNSWKGWQDCNNYPGISLLSTAYKILSNILLAML